MPITQSTGHACALQSTASVGAGQDVPVTLRLRVLKPPAHVFEHAP